MSNLPQGLIKKIESEFVNLMLHKGIRGKTKAYNVAQASYYSAILLMFEYQDKNLQVPQKWKDAINLNNLIV